MAILAECDICGSQHRVKDSTVGSAIRCKDCGAQFTVPDGPSISPETYVEEGGRLYRRDAEPESSVWPPVAAWLVAGLAAASLAGSVWALLNLMRPAAKPPAQVSVSQGGSLCGRRSESVPSAAHGQRPIQPIAEHGASKISQTDQER